MIGREGGLGGTLIPCFGFVKKRKKQMNAKKHKRIKMKY